MDWLQRPFDREYSTGKAILHGSSLIQGFGQRLKDRFHDGVRVEGFRTPCFEWLRDQSLSQYYPTRAILVRVRAVRALNGRE